MYHYLRDKSQDLLVPGLTIIPENSISLLKTNPRFIKSFMIGVNHEFASELRWREFPTNMVGSYFRKFWDSTIYSVDNEEREEFRASVIGEILTEKLGVALTDIEELFNKTVALTAQEKQLTLAYENAIESWLLSREEEQDIQPPIDWASNSRLEANNLATLPKTATNQIVILIRGDLLKQYPNAIVYLAKKNAAGKPDYSSQVFPVFEGQLPPDVGFLGFPIADAQANQYFIVFEEPMADIRYGLDANKGNGWQNAGWDAINEGAYLNATKPYNDNSVSYWDSPSGVATVFTQHSVRLAVDLEILMNKMKGKN